MTAKFSGFGVAAYAYRWLRVNSCDGFSTPCWLSAGVHRAQVTADCKKSILGGGGQFNSVTNSARKKKH